MTDGTINVSFYYFSIKAVTKIAIRPQLLQAAVKLGFQEQMDTMVDYDNTLLSKPVLDSIRTNIFDAILIYGFTAGKATTGIVKATLTIFDGLRWA